jgi:hypothetical protein
VLSEAYLKAEFTQPEIAAAFAQDPNERKAPTNTRTRDSFLLSMDPVETNNLAPGTLQRGLKRRRMDGSRRTK